MYYQLDTAPIYSSPVCQAVPESAIPQPMDWRCAAGHRFHWI